MARRVVLHIGVMKSGTSYLQRRLSANAPALAEQGILFPGERWTDQVRAVQDVLGRKRQGVKPAHLVGAWKKLVQQVAAWDDTAVVSMELLTTARPKRIRRIVAAFEPAQVEVVVTARDLGRAVPAMWQEGTKTFKTWTWEEYLDGVRNGDPEQPGPARTFWRQQDLPRILAQWSAAATPERVTLVTLPPPGSDPDVLWQRFSSVVGIAPGSWVTAPPSNESLGAPSAELMRRVNVALAETDLTWGEYSRFGKHALAKAVLAGRKREEPAIGFDDDWVASRADELIRALRELPVRVVGDLEDLRPVAVPGINPSQAPVEDQLDAAVDALAQLLHRWATQEREPDE